MLLKIFTKRKPHGEIIDTNYHWKDWYFEGSEIESRPEGNTFHFAIKKQGDEIASTAVVDKETMGYELYNDSGVLIEKFVTPVD